MQVPQLDEYISGLMLPSELLRALSAVPHKERLRMFKSTYGKQPDQPETWLAKCLENWHVTVAARNRNPYEGLPRPLQSIPYPSPSSSTRTQGGGPSLATSPPASPSASSPAGLSESSMKRCRGDSGEFTPQRKALFQPAGRVQPPTWAVNMQGCLDNKSQALALFLAVLNTDSRQHLTALLPAVQWQVALCCMLSPSAWLAVNDAVAAFLSARTKLEESRVNPESSQESAPPFKMVAVTVGLGIGSGLCCLAESLKFLQGQQTCCPVLDAVYSFEVDPDALAVEGLVAQQLAVPLTSSGDMGELVGFLKQSIPLWQNYFVVLLARLPANADKVWRCPLPNGAPNKVTVLRDAVQFLTSKCPLNFLYLVDIPEQSVAADEAWLTETFGDPWFAPMQYYAATSRVHHVRSNLLRPRGTLVHRYSKADLTAVVDGLQWHPHGSAGTLVMTSAPSEAICLGAAERLFDPGSIGAEVHRGLEVQTAVIVETHEESLMSVKLWLSVLGLLNSPVGKALVHKFPCFKNIVQSTGFQCAPGHVAVPCGSGRWCHHCEKCLKLLGKSWHVPLMSDVVISFLVTARAACAEGDLAAFRGQNTIRPSGGGASNYSGTSP